MPSRNLLTGKLQCKRVLRAYSSIPCLCVSFPRPLVQASIANAHLTLAENLRLIGDKIDVSVRHGTALATRLRQEAGRVLAMVMG